MKVLAVSGSLRSDSYNAKLLRAAERLLPDGVGLEIWDGLKDVPPYDEDDDVEPAPAAVAALRAAIAGADALLFATPEYNSSVPGQLKNALDWVSRPLAKNPLRGKPIAVVGASTGAFGAVWSQAELRKVLAAMGDGDEIVVTDPTYAGIVNRIHVTGGTPRFAPFRVVEGEWRLDRDALVGATGPATRGLLLMSPSMPSGGTFDEDDWRLVCDLCRERDLFLIYDAAMERLLFDGRPLVHPLRFEGMAERTIVVGSLSKEHRMIGWRVGWVAGPADVVEDVGWAHVYNTTTPVGIARAAATAVLRGDQAHVAEAVDELERRRDTMLSGLAGWPLVRPGGGWSLLLDVSALGFEPEEASRLLLEESSIAATGMRGWGGEVAARYVRFVFSAEPVERLETIPERLAGGSLARAL